MRDGPVAHSEPATLRAMRLLATTTLVALLGLTAVPAAAQDSRADIEATMRRPTTVYDYRKAIWDQDARVMDSTAATREVEETKRDVLRIWYREDTVLRSKPMIVGGVVLMALGVAASVGAVALIASIDRRNSFGTSGYALAPIALGLFGGGLALTIVGSAPEMKRKPVVRPEEGRGTLLMLTGTF